MSSYILEGSRCFQKKRFESCHPIFPRRCLESSTQKVYKLSTTESPIWMDCMYPPICPTKGKCLKGKDRLPTTIFPGTLQSWGKYFVLKVFEGRCIFSKFFVGSKQNMCINVGSHHGFRFRTRVRKRLLIDYPKAI